MIKKLNSQDKELLHKLSEISKKILKIYNNLYYLEINNQKNSLEYEQNLEYLDICLELEQELYKKVNKEKIYDYIKHTDDTNLFETFSDYDTLLNDFCDLYFLKRVYNKLNNLALENLVELYQNSDIEKNDYPSFDVSIFITNQIHDDIENLLIYLTTNLSKENKVYEQELIKIKYMISYFNPRIENNIKNSFENQNQVILLSKAISDTFDIDDKNYNKLLLSYFLKYIKIHINGLINIKDQDYQEHFQRLRSRIYENIIRAYLEMEPSNIDSLYAHIHDIINMNTKNKTSVLLLKKILKEAFSDKNIIKLRSEALVINEISK